jgi:Ser-tRNA(Ala) deacylase AlaX
MTVRRFWSDPYQTFLVSSVTEVIHDEVQVAESIFFAESGGQESDQGSIGGHAVLAARQIDDQLVYTLGCEHGLKVGEQVQIEIDWPRRYALMRLHFAAEIVLEVASGKFGLTNKIGAHIGPERARIDFLSDTPVSALLDDLRQSAQAWIDADLPIVSAFEDEARLRRYWQVEGLARVPCGGTHLKRTGEVGQLMLKRRNTGRGKERIEISAISPS